jgi:O-antigen ligase
MTSFVCFLGAASLMIATTLSSVFRRRGVLVAGVAALLFFAVFTVFFAPDLLSRIGRDPTLTGRTAIWNQVLALSGNPIVGTGFESFWLGPRLQQMWSLYWWHPNEAHNGYIEVFLDLGWVGVALFGMLVLTGLRRILASVHQQTEAAELMLAFFVAALIYNLTESGVRELNPMWFVFLLTVMAVSHSALTTEGEDIDGIHDTETELHELVEAGSLTGAV